MIDALIYRVMQTLGYRKFYFDQAFIRGINLDSFECWRWQPNFKKGTYRERSEGWNYAGYGVDK